MARGNNLSKVFSEIVSLDAWHSKFCDSTDSASVHVDLSFLEGHLGAESESEVRFKLTLKRAELIFVIPAMEPLQVIQSSVDREATVEGIRRYLREHDKQLTGSLEAAMQISQNPSLNLGAKATSQNLNKETVTTEMKLPISNFRMSQSKDPDGNYRWIVMPETGDLLMGKVWDPIKRPRLSVKKSGASIIAPTCRVIVRCRKQDFNVSEITLKSGKKLGQKFLFNRTAAATAFISQRLGELGFDNENLDEEYANICVAEVTVSQEVK